MADYSSTVEIRDRADAARKVADAPFLGDHGAVDYRIALRDALALLDLYVGHEPTLTEEARYVHEEQVREQVADELLAAANNPPGYLSPEAVRRRHRELLVASRIARGAEMPSTVPGARAVGQQAERRRAEGEA